MELTRRDALAALASVSAVAGGGLAGQAVDIGAPRADDTPSGGEVFEDGETFNGGEMDVLQTLVAAAEVLYPSAVEGHESFVEAYTLGRVADRPDYRDGLVATVAELDGVARDWHDAGYARLDYGTRDTLLRELGVDAADADPTGNISDRVRFYVVDELLYALYTSPTGGRLAGIENPTGYPGGTESYRRGPGGEDGRG